MVDGYFNGKVPAEFWELLALYISSNMLSSVPWAIPFGEHEVTTMLNQARDVLRWYDGMRSVVPSWYAKKACTGFGFRNGWNRQQEECTVAAKLIDRLEG